MDRETQTRLRSGDSSKEGKICLRKGGTCSTEGKICLRRGRFVYRGGDSSKKGRGDKGQIQYQLVASHQVYACI
jgi:hypothetical protein